jgi:murein DD-endopeptidase MepM/ murein hydrolase activator NlpD
MSHVSKIIFTLFLFWGLIACNSSYVERTTLANTPSLRSELSQATVTPIPTRYSKTSTPSQSLITLVSSKESSGDLFKTPIPGLIMDYICPPLEHETIASLIEIVTDPYNPPPMGRDERHQGVDFSYYHRGERDSIGGLGIRSIMPGVVAASINNRLPYGNMVIIETPFDMLPEGLVSDFKIGKDKSLYHLYAHMQSPPQVQIGDDVECGEELGAVGMTGYAIVNPHLHLETRIGKAGERFSEMAFYTTDATLQEMQNYQRWRMTGEFRHFDPMSLFSWFIQH